MTFPRGDVLAFIILLIVAGGVFLAHACHLGQATGAREPVTLSDQEQALKIVWQDMFGMDPALAPEIVWVRADELNCAGGRGWKVRPIPPHIPNCVAGLYLADLGMALVAWPKGNWNISDTAFAHELAHALSWYYYGLPDSPHASEFFKSGGLVEQANTALKAVGL